MISERLRNDIDNSEMKLRIYVHSNFLQKCKDQNIKQFIENAVNKIRDIKDQWVECENLTIDKYKEFKKMQSSLEGCVEPIKKHVPNVEEILKAYLSTLKTAVCLENLTIDEKEIASMVRPVIENMQIDKKLFEKIDDLVNSIIKLMHTHLIKSQQKHIQPNLENACEEVLKIVDSCLNNILLTDINFEKNLKVLAQLLLTITKTIPHTETACWSLLDSLAKITPMKEHWIGSTPENEENISKETLEKTLSTPVNYTILCIKLNCIASKQINNSEKKPSELPLTVLSRQNQTKLEKYQNKSNGFEKQWKSPKLDNIGELLKNSGKEKIDKYTGPTVNSIETNTIKVNSFCN